jgi:hypothetical protein
MRFSWVSCHLANSSVRSQGCLVRNDMNATAQPPPTLQSMQLQMNLHMSHQVQSQTHTQSQTLKQ